MIIAALNLAIEAAAAFEKVRAELTQIQLAFNHRERQILITRDFDGKVAHIIQALAAVARPIDEERKLALAPLEAERRAQRVVVISNHDPADDYQSEMMTGVGLLGHKLADLDADLYRRSEAISQPYRDRKAAAQLPYLEQLKPFEIERAKRQRELTTEYQGFIGPTYLRVTEAWRELREALQRILLELGGKSVLRVDIDLDLSWRDDKYHHRILTDQNNLLAEQKALV